jgi:hypothetical protein
MDLQRDSQATRGWFAQAELARVWHGDAATPGPGGEVDSGDEPDRWSAHVDEARRVLEDGAAELGAPPADLVEVLAWLAVGGAANNALRALSRVTGGSRAMLHTAVRNAAGRIGHGLRSLFNQPEVMTSLRREGEDERYWLRVLEYSAGGCLAAVLDEYAHVALEADNLAGGNVDEIASGIADRMISALTLQTATLRADVVSLNRESESVRLEEAFGFRTAFAVRYGARGEEGAVADRNQRLQVAFNSPFWPFVLCTTSVGQEGLDFHSYCHAVVHWNLPSNPVDLEQREGRVHRYKGHAVRKNVARRHRSAALAPGAPNDPWAAMFKAARDEAVETDSDLVPYWVYCDEGGARIERHVPALPLSRDAERKTALRRSLTLYRMAFGQARQEDLVAFLLQHVPPDEQQQLITDLTIRLAPPPSQHRAASGQDAVVTWAEEAPLALETAPGDRSVTLGPSLATFGDLLNAFRALAPRGGSNREPERTNRAEIERLLDAFAVLRGRRAKTQAQATADGVGDGPQVHRLADLLDAFAAVRPVPRTTKDRIDGLRSLLDSYVSVSSARRRASV